MPQAEQWGWYLSDAGQWLQSSDNRIMLFATRGEAVATLNGRREVQAIPGLRIARMHPVTGMPMGDQSPGDPGSSVSTRSSSPF